MKATISVGAFSSTLFDKETFKEEVRSFCDHLEEEYGMSVDIQFER